MKQYSLKDVFEQPLAIGEFRWRFVCAVTKENVAEAWTKLKVYDAAITDIKESVEYWHNLPEDKKILRTFGIVAVVLRNEEARRRYEQQREEETVKISADYNSGAEVLYEYLKEKP